MADYNQDSITQDVVDAFAKTPDPRLRQLMTALVKHIHAYAREVDLKPGEWLAAMKFLEATGQISTDKRPEFILLSDTLGLSILVDKLNHQVPGSATETTVLGPFYRPGAQELPPGGNMATIDRTGTPLLITGRVTDGDGTPVADAVLDCWQATSEGFYDSQMGDGEELGMRGVYRTDSDGRYLVRTTRPKFYPVPTDGPVGDMLRATDRHPFRPGHVHFMITAPGYRPLVTHIFDKSGDYLDSDTVFAVKDSLKVDFREQATQEALGQRAGVQPPYVTAEFDFVLSPA
jgi:hydroxyquinol 1,2-dioxygenase